MDNQPFPESYDQWRECIEVKCQLPLTKAFCEKRLKVLQDASNAETKRFILHYSEVYLQQICQWYTKTLSTKAGSGR